MGTHFKTWNWASKLPSWTYKVEGPFKRLIRSMADFGITQADDWHAIDSLVPEADHQKPFRCFPTRHSAKLEMIDRSSFFSFYFCPSLIYMILISSIWNIFRLILLYMFGSIMLILLFISQILCTWIIYNFFGIIGRIPRFVFIQLHKDKSILFRTVSYVCFLRITYFIYYN